ncbi:hypothetical protein LIER_06987 [Lithospermum erythrorhizon]|uniref:Reverse transcriptase domain-containing protein n=1 Tax=Lithospermum erythrorhizon TaxID=34254 RepID=A0AAV3PB79_LITER
MKLFFGTSVRRSWDASTSEVFLGWVIECVTSACYSISINGELHGHFPGKYELRQGDPMSPILFLFYIEYFSRLCIVREIFLSFCYNPICAEEGIIDLAFVDDLILFARGNVSSVDILMSFLTDLERASGLTVSPSKSSIYLARVRGPKRDAMLVRVGFCEGVFPVRYLGIPLNPLKLSIAQFSPLIYAISGYIQKWFLVTCLSHPPAIVTKVASLCIFFLWGGSKKSKVRWEDVCVPKDKRGSWSQGYADLEVCLSPSCLCGVSTLDYVARPRDSLLMRRLCGLSGTLISYGSRADAIEGLEGCIVMGELVSSLVYKKIRTPRVKRPWMSCIWKGFIPP